MIRTLIFALLAGILPIQAALRNEQTYYEMCGASAAVALDNTHFVVADDEVNSLRVYERGVERPIQIFDLSRFLSGHRRGKEADLEGAARVGDVIYWIGSHGRDRAGNEAPQRQEFFAVRVLLGGKALEPVGRPYRGLLADIEADARFDRFGFKEAAKISPKEHGGLNIEGLCARPDGSLLIGFRSPIAKGKTLLLPLLNPDKVIEGEKAKFGEMIELDLGGLGVRDMCPNGNKYLILAGDRKGGDRFELFSWDGGEHLKRLKEKFGKLNPEALFRFGNDPAGVYQVLSDDGSMKIDGMECKDLPPSKRRFRSVEITVKH